MIDGHRKYPVYMVLLHHSTGPVFKDASDREVQDWYSDIGKARGYQNGAINPRHEHPSRKGQLTYAMAQFTGRPYTKDGNKYGYRLTDLIKNPWANVAWHAGNWEINISSVGLENCGNFMNKLLTEKQLMCIADWLRPVDRELVQAGHKAGLTILLHQEVFATACPGRIKEQRNKLVDMINNPDKWNKKLWPPKPKVTTKTVTETQPVPYATETVEDTSITKDEVRVKGVNGTRTITYEITYTDGKETKRVKKSDKVTTQPITEVIAKAVQVETPVVDDINYGKENNALLKQLLSLVTQILDKLTNIFK